MIDFQEIEEKIGYTFKDKKYLLIALTHSSFSNEFKDKDRENNERQEFLGDSVLSLITSEYLFKLYDTSHEGDLTQIRAGLVCEKTLFGFAKEIGLGKYLRLGKGEEITGGRERASLLADAFEALIAAIYLDGGIENARKFVLGFISKAIEEKPTFVDYKTLLQEVIQQNSEETLQYILVRSSGPDHDKRFEVEVHLNSNVIGRGIGKSKKEAEQLAAKEASELMGL